MSTAWGVMKIRDSDMPDEATWDGFFDPDAILGALSLTADCGDVVEFGCGYGTFTVPAARLVQGNVFALDLDPEMIATTHRRAVEAKLDNVVLDRRDFLATGSGLGVETVGYAMVFNILHLQQPGQLLGEAHRVLRHGGLLAIAHWNHDPATPRGPDMSFRPHPEQCLGWAEAAGFARVGRGAIDLPPYHWGVVLEKKIDQEEK